MLWNEEGMWTLMTPRDTHIWMLSHRSAHWIILCQLDTGWNHLRWGNLNWEKPPSWDQALGRHIGHFLNYWLIGKDRAHCGLYKKTCWAIYGEQSSKLHPSNGLCIDSCLHLLGLFEFLPQLPLMINKGIEV